VGVIEDLQRICGALDVSLSVLALVAVGGFAALTVAASTHSTAPAAVACVAGVVLLASGLRAAMRPARPFEIQSLNRSNPALSYINTSRRLGLFYVLVGVVWIVGTLSVTRSS
jgi:uncharacterized membrane protein HdeD (DUF308 family)